MSSAHNNINPRFAEIRIGGMRVSVHQMGVSFAYSIRAQVEPLGAGQVIFSPEIPMLTPPATFGWQIRANPGWNFLGWSANWSNGNTYTSSAMYVTDHIMQYANLLLIGSFAPCTYVAPAFTQSVSAYGGGTAARVSEQRDCTPGGYSDAPWLRVTSQQSGYVNLIAEPNNTGVTRLGAVRVGTHAYWFSQDPQ